MEHVQVVIMHPYKDDDHLRYERLETLCSERETMLHTLQRQIKGLEGERDQALNGLEVITQGLRRRGCCDTPNDA